jgi:hypothetical protein
MTLSAAAKPLAQAANASSPQPAKAGQLIGVRARLEKNLDARRMKPGDTILARPEAKVHLADGVDLNTDCRLLGRVDKIQPSVGGTDSAIAVTFFAARMKDGREIPVKATILWIRQPPDMLNPSIVSAPADRTTPGVGVEAGMTSQPPVQGYQGSEIAGTSRQLEGAPGKGKGAAANPDISVEFDAIPGVNFFSDLGRDDSGWFRSKGKSVFIPGGTVLAFALVLTPNP